MAKGELSIDEEIQRLLRALTTVPAGSELYKFISDDLKVLCEARAQKKATWTIEPETVVKALVGLLELALVLNHERLDVITSKAFGWLGKMKL